MSLIPIIYYSIIIFTSLMVFILSASYISYKIKNRGKAKKRASSSSNQKNQNAVSKRVSTQNLVNYPQKENKNFRSVSTYYSSGYSKPVKYFRDKEQLQTKKTPNSIDNIPSHSLEILNNSHVSRKRSHSVHPVRTSYYENNTGVDSKFLKNFDTINFYDDKRREDFYCLKTG